MDAAFGFASTWLERGWPRELIIGIFARLGTLYSANPMVIWGPGTNISLSGLLRNRKTQTGRGWLWRCAEGKA